MSIVWMQLVFHDKCLQYKVLCVIYTFSISKENISDTIDSKNDNYIKVPSNTVYRKITMHYITIQTQINIDIAIFVFQYNIKYKQF